MQPKEFSHSDISLYKSTWFNFLLDPIKVTIYVPSDIYPNISHLNNKTHFVTLLSWYLETDITIPMPWNIFLSADLVPDLFKLEHNILSD